MSRLGLNWLIYVVVCNCWHSGVVAGTFLHNIHTGNYLFNFYQRFSDIHKSTVWKGLGLDVLHQNTTLTTNFKYLEIMPVCWRFGGYLRILWTIASVSLLAMFLFVLSKQGKGASVGQWHMSTADDYFILLHNLLIVEVFYLCDNIFSFCPLHMEKENFTHYFLTSYFKIDIIVPSLITLKK